MSQPMIDLIVTHLDEPWSVGKKFFDMLAMQRNIDFDDIRVILVQDGPETALNFGQLLKDYPYRVRMASITRSGTSVARNTGLCISDAEWVMFCDYDDMFADVAALRGILGVLPTDDADIIWMKTYREERVRATKRDHSGCFINCMDENFYSTSGKLYRRQALLDHQLTFHPDLHYEYESAFNHLALSLIPSHRVLGLTVDFYPYMKTLREDSHSMLRENLIDRMNDLYIRDRFLVDEYARRDLPILHQDMVAETIFDMYYLLNCKPTVPHADLLLANFTDFYRENRKTFEEMRDTECETILDNCVNKMLSTVQNLYNYFAIEAEPPFDGIERIRDWLRSLIPDANEADQQASERNISTVHPVISSPSSVAYDGPRVVIYCGTYNTYPNMIASAKSLLSHTRVDHVYFLTEDDVFPYDLPSIITNINVKNQTTFPADGPNFDNVWSYMCMMRATFPDMFPQFDRALSLDIDIIINEDIGHLWNLNLDDYYYAGVPEPGRQRNSSDPVYCNFGVIMMNLKKMREDGIGAKTIRLLNSSKLGCPEQDAFNKTCAYHILPLPPDYNYTPFSHITGEPENEIITHYAGLKYWKHFKPVRQYAGQDWSQIPYANPKGDYDT